jgi:dihydroorotase
VLDLLRGRFTLSDNSGEKVIAQEMLTPAFSIRAGRVVAADSTLIPPAVLLAA